MFADCVASSSRLAVQDNWDPLPSLWTFPVSDCRYESTLPDTHPRGTSATPQQPRAKPSAQPLAPSTPFCATNIPVRRQLSPGVWTDGQNTVFSSAIPEVQHLLATARSSLALPTASSELIFTLAALEVFYKPADPVHWLFWSDEKKGTTADIVTRISLHRPPLIISPVAWNGKPEYLSILASHHGTTWRPIYESKSWFTVVVPPKPSTPPRQLNLRKRRVAPGAFRDPSRSPGLEDIDDELGQAGISRAPSLEPTEDIAPPIKVDKRISKSRASRAKPKPLPTLSPLSSRSSSPQVAVLTLSPEQDLEALSAEAEVGEMATRSKRKVSVPSRYPRSVSCTQETPSVECSILLGPGQHPVPLADSAVSGHSRTRSTSTDSSGKTAVASDVSRSASVASGRTAVETGELSLSKKRKALEDGVDSNGEGVDLADGDEEGEEDNAPAGIPHGRSRRLRKGLASGSLDVAISEKAASARSGSTVRTNRKRARKV